MTFDEFVSAYLPDGAKAYLKESLREGKGVHFYGLEGTGKSMLCEQFRQNGFTQVTEPGLTEIRTISSGPYGIPVIIKNVSLIELCGIRKPLTEQERFSREDIEAWIKV